MDKKFSEKVVIITGALGGLGRVLVRMFAGNGAKVMACFRGNPKRFEKERELSILPDVYPYNFDVNHKDAVETAIRKIIDKYKQIDVLINNAGVNIPAPFTMTDDTVWETTIATNLSGVRRLCMEVAGPMMVQKSGVIINISSVLAHTLGRGSSAYAASKAALERFTEIAAVEMGKRGVRINAVAPGFCDAGMAVSMIPQAEKIALDRIALKRKGSFEEVAQAVLFLASDQASYITGHTLTVDGGLSYG
jgi:3-oxoacyl-[acyl-carrier protein] reductase